MTSRNKGGRPPVKNKREFQLCSQFNLLEKKIIENQAKKANVKISEFLRTLAIKGEVKVKTIPKIILHIMASLNHNSSNINQITRQANIYRLLSDSEKEQLFELIKTNQQIVEMIREEFRNDR